MSIEERVAGVNQRIHADFTKSEFPSSRQRLHMIKPGNLELLSSGRVINHNAYCDPVLQRAADFVGCDQP